MREIHLTEKDSEHIARLQALQDVGTHNMFMECKAGLEAYFDDAGTETYYWVTDHFDLFESGEWKDIDPTELPTTVEIEERE